MSSHRLWKSMFGCLEGCYALHLTIFLRMEVSHDTNMDYLQSEHLAARTLWEPVEGLLVFERHTYGSTSNPSDIPTPLRKRRTERNFMLYLGFKLFHIIAVVLFLGNIIAGLFWKAHADRTRDPLVVSHTFGGIKQSDRWFTIPGVISSVMGSLGAAIVGGIPILGTGWILWAIVLFSLSGLAFSFRVAPLQIQLAAFARAGAESG